MNIKYAAFAAATLLACNAQAATVTINSITGKWINPVGGVAVSVDNSNSPSSIRWGNGVSSGPQSGYDFTPTMPQPIITGLNTSFALGEFAHLNFPVTGGAITDVDLQVTFDLTLDDGAGGNITGVQSTIHFDHLETTNSASPCAAGGSSPCPDLVTIVNSSAMADTFTLNGVEYSLFLSGFSGGNSNADGSLSFLTLEDQQNTAFLNGIVTANAAPPVSEVPVPAALPLMLTALGGLGFLGARRRSKA